MRSLRAIRALLRASWLTAASYKVGLVLSLGALFITAVPIYFMTQALQGTMAGAISQEAQSFPGFIFVGVAATFWIAAATSVVADVTQQSINDGTLEVMLATRTRFPTIIAGLASYPVALIIARTLILLIVAALFGVPFVWGNVPLGLAVLALLTVAYLPIGLFAMASVLRFRQVSPLGAAAMVVSSTLGGVYFPTTVIPGWVRGVSAFIPMTYGLRAARQVMLLGASFADISRDVFALAGFAVVFNGLGLVAVSLALKYARRTGTLSQP